MAATLISGPFLFRPDSDNVGLGYEGLPIALLNQIGSTGLLGIQYYFNHFLQWEGPLTEAAASGWTLSGVTGVATITLSDVRNGEITLTADGTAGADPTLQLGSATVGMNFRYVVGKRLWCHARVKMGTVASTEALFGMATADSEPTVTNTFPADGIFFEKASTATKWDFHARQDGTSTEKTAIGTTLADATYSIIGFMVDVSGNIQPYQDGSAVAAGLISAGDANLPDAAGDTLQFMVGFRGASQTLALDWLLLAQEL